MQQRVQHVLQRKVRHRVAHKVRLPLQQERHEALQEAHAVLALEHLSELLLVTVYARVCVLLNEPNPKEEKKIISVQWFILFGINCN